MTKTYSVEIDHNDETCAEQLLCERFEDLGEARARFDQLKETFDEEYGDLDVTLWLFEGIDEGMDASMDCYPE